MYFPLYNYIKKTTAKGNDFKYDLSDNNFNVEILSTYLFR